MVVRRYVWLAAIAGCHPVDTLPAIGEPTYTVEELTDPATCQGCHPNQYKEWSGSMHAYATDDPLFVALNKRAQESNVGGFCTKCHAPMAAHLDQADASIEPASIPKHLRGVTCYFCHNADAVLSTHNNPLHLADDVVMRGEYADAVPNEAHHSAYSTYHDRTRTESAALCGACHDIVNRHETHIERTYEEWQKTVFGNGSTGGSTCGRCHMAGSTNPEPIAQGPKVSGVFARKTHSHMFPAIDVAITEFPEIDAQRKAVQEFLDPVLQTALCVRGFPGSPPNLEVIVDNIGGGHRFPTGAAQDRRLWFEVTAYKEGQEIYKSGGVQPGTEPTKVEKDPDMWLLRDCVFDGEGKETHDFWNAVAFESNTLPGQLTIDRSNPDFYKSHVYQNFPRAADSRLSAYPDRVTLRAYVQPFPLDFFDEAFANPPALGYTDDEVKAMRARLAPLTIGKELEWTAEAVGDKATGGQTYYENNVIPRRCVTNTASNAGADKDLAVNHKLCAP